MSGWSVAMLVGAVFIILGLGMVTWGKREEKGYYDSLVARTDLKEFFARWPKRPEPESLKIGGWICVAVGLTMAVIGGVFWLTG